MSFGTLNEGTKDEFDINKGGEPNCLLGGIAFQLGIHPINEIEQSLEKDGEYKYKIRINLKDFTRITKYLLTTKDLMPGDPRAGLCFQAKSGVIDWDEKRIKLFHHERPLGTFHWTNAEFPVKAKTSTDSVEFEFIFLPATILDAIKLQKNIVNVTLDGDRFHSSEVWNNSTINLAAYISFNCFCEIVKFVLTSCSLSDLNDPRVALFNMLAGATTTEGYNQGGERLRAN